MQKQVYLLKCFIFIENELIISERQGIEIDYCSQCCGVWLDRGELDKIIERSYKFEESKNKLIEKESDSSDHRKYYSDLHYKNTKENPSLDKFLTSDLCRQ